MGEALKKLGGAVGGMFFGLGLMVGGVLGAFHGARNQQEPWQRNLDNLAKYLDKLFDPNQEPNPPDGCKSAQVRLYNARQAAGAPTYILDRLERRLREVCSQ